MQQHCISIWQHFNTNGNIAKLWGNIAIVYGNILILCGNILILYGNVLILYGNIVILTAICRVTFLLVQIFITPWRALVGKRVGWVIFAHPVAEFVRAVYLTTVAPQSPLARDTNIYNHTRTFISLSMGRFWWTLDTDLLANGAATTVSHSIGTSHSGQDIAKSDSFSRIYWLTAWQLNHIQSLVF